MFAASLSDDDAEGPAGVAEHFREQVLREVHHRVKNHLQVLQGLVRQDAAGANSSERRMAERLVTRIGGMAAIYKAFQDAAERTSIPAVELLESICEPLSTAGRRIVVVGDRLLRFSTGQAEFASMLVSEAVCNSLEHAFPADREGRIEVSVRLAQGCVHLLIEDNGIGFDPKIDSGSNGLKIMTALAGELGGRIGFPAPEAGGSGVLVVFPVDTH